MSFLREVLERLVRADVRFVVVGGVAVVLHGHLRATKDLDLVVDLEPAAARKAIEVLLQMGLRPTAPVNPLDFADGAIRQTWVDAKNMTVFQLYDPNDARNNVDLFADLPMEFEPMWERSVAVNVGEVRVRVAAIPDLIEMKRRAGRPIDRDDVEQLQKLEDLRRGGR